MSRDIVPARLQDGEGNHCEREQREKVDGLQAPQVRIVWIKSELPATRIMNRAHVQPMVRCGSVPLGARSCMAPRPIATNAKAAWYWMTGGAPSSGASVTTRLA